MSFLVVIATAAALLLPSETTAEKIIPNSLFKPAFKRELTREVRWKLDFELANEISMETNSRRFDGVDAFIKRAQWIEQEAASYQIADLVQQIMDVKRGKARINESAFNQMVELGLQGDEGASCMADFLYQYHPREDTTRWKYSRELVTRQSLKAKAESGHPVCAGMESRFYLRGEMGHPKDAEKAKPFVIEGAVAGFFADQTYMAGTHLLTGQIIESKNVERQLCWLRVADRFSAASFFSETCDMFSRGPAFNRELKSVEVPEHIKVIARKWCAPAQEVVQVTAQECADLEYK